MLLTLKLIPKNDITRLTKILFLSVLATFLIVFSSVIHAKQILVETDRQTVEMGDVITLLIQADFQVGNSQIDFTQLKDQFDILGQQQSNQVEIINGKFNSFTRWQVKLLPKQVGKLVIPPFELEGIKSKPYPIKVLKAQFTDSNRPYFLEAQVDKNKVYVQEQVLYTLRFFHKGSLINGNIRPPKFGDALVEQLKEQSVYGKTINGQQYTVYEWQYAFFPQSSGKLDIPGPSFTGMLQLRGGQKGIRAIAKPTSIEVLPKINQNLNYWLPAKSVKITQKWESLPQTVHVGDSLRRVITLKVDGVKSSQLPEIKTENGASFKVYADTSNKKQTISVSGISSTLTLAQAIVPSAEGALQLPAITVTWLNTQTNQLETTTLESKPINVWPANASIPNVVTQQTPTDKKLALPTEPEGVQAQVYQNYQLETNSVHWYWMLAAGALGLIWLITLLLLVNIRSQVKKLTDELEGEENNKTTEKPTLAFNKQWCDMPINEFYQELLRQLHEDLDITSVKDIDNPVLRNAVLQLESHLFAGRKLEGNTILTICDNWAALINRKNEEPAKSSKKAKQQELVDLYKS